MTWARHVCRPIEEMCRPRLLLNFVAGKTEAWAVGGWGRSRSQEQSSSLSTVHCACLEDRQRQGPVSRVTPAAPRAPQPGICQALLPTSHSHLPPSQAQTCSQQGHSNAQISWVAPRPQSRSMGYGLACLSH